MRRVLQQLRSAEEASVEEILGELAERRGRGHLGKGAGEGRKAGGWVKGVGARTGEIIWAQAQET